ncbi:28036_t:CDS:1, partial [Dentiscutata erythropus]
MGVDICTDHNSYSGSPPLAYNSTSNVRSRISRSNSYPPTSNNKPSVSLEVCTSYEYQPFDATCTSSEFQLSNDINVIVNNLPDDAVPHIQIVQYNSENRFKGSGNEFDICSPRNGSGISSNLRESSRDYNLKDESDNNNLKDESDNNNLKDESDNNNLNDGSDNNNLNDESDNNSLKDGSDSNNIENRSDDHNLDNGSKDYDSRIETKEIRPEDQNPGSKNGTNSHNSGCYNSSNGFTDLRF